MLTPSAGCSERAAGRSSHGLVGVEVLARWEGLERRACLAHTNDVCRPSRFHNVFSPGVAMLDQLVAAAGAALVAAMATGYVGAVARRSGLTVAARASRAGRDDRGRVGGGP